MNIFPVSNSMLIIFSRTCAEYADMDSVCSASIPYTSMIN